MTRITLRIEISDPKYAIGIADALSEGARHLEQIEQQGEPLGLIPNPEIPGSYCWEIVREEYVV